MITDSLDPNNVICTCECTICNKKPAVWWGETATPTCNSKKCNEEIKRLFEEHRILMNELHDE